MAVMVLFRSAKVDKALYDAIMQAVDLERDPPPGGLTHACSFDSDGVLVVDVWETREQFQAFLETRLAPVFARLKVEVDPPVVLDTHSLYATDEVDRYKLKHPPGLSAA